MWRYAFIDAFYTSLSVTIYSIWLLLCNIITEKQNSNSSCACITLTWNLFRASSVSSFHPFFQTGTGSPLPVILNLFMDKHCYNEKRLGSTSFGLTLRNWNRISSWLQMFSIYQASVGAEVWLNSEERLLTPFCLQMSKEVIKIK